MGKDDFFWGIPRTRETEKPRNFREMAEKSREISWVWGQPSFFNVFIFSNFCQNLTRILGKFLEIIREISWVPGYLSHCCQIHAHLHNKCKSTWVAVSRKCYPQHLIDFSHIIPMPFAYAKACKEDTYHTFIYFKAIFVQVEDLV